VARALLVTRGVYPFAAGGIGIHVYYASKKLSETLDISVITQFTNDVEDKLLDFGRTKVVFIPASSISILSSFIFVFMGLFNFLRKVGRVDVVHAHQALSPAILAFLISRFHRVPLIITCHGSEIRTQRKKGPIWLLQRFVLEKASYLTAVSGEMKDILVKDYDVNPSKILVIPNGYDEDAVTTILRNKRKDSFSRIVFVGSLRPFKDPLTLMKGFQEISKKHPDAELLIIGSGPLETQLKKFSLEKRLSSHVIFAGRTSHEEALNAIAESTVFVLTSIEEGLPTVLIEAMALKKPIIATMVGAVPEIVHDGINGILIPPRSPESVAKAVEMLLSDSKLRETLGQAAAESVRDCTWCKIAEKYATIYGQVCKPKPKEQRK
jgi:glycosyltransferase involved in cell wall biosynthesis